MGERVHRREGQWALGRAGAWEIQSGPYLRVADPALFEQLHRKALADVQLEVDVAFLQLRLLLRLVLFELVLRGRQLRRHDGALVPHAV